MSRKIILLTLLAYIIATATCQPEPRGRREDARRTEPVDEQPEENLVTLEAEEPEAKHLLQVFGL